MMTLYLILGGVVIAALGSLLFSTLTYSLRDFSRARLSDVLERRGRSSWLQVTLDHGDDLIFVTAVGRLCFTLLVLVGVLALFNRTGWSLPVQYLLALLVSGVICLFCSIAIPHAAARYAGEAAIGLFVRPLHGLRIMLMPFTKVMHAIDHIIRHASGANGETEPEEIEQEILSAVEEGEKEGVVDVQEREMIESVIEFRDTQVGQIMTARPEIVGIEEQSSLEKVKRTIEETGHSRIPVYEGTLDHIVGVLYARDLIKHVGSPPDGFDIRSAMRPAYYVPETKPLRDLLQDFRLQKVHLAIVLDEYGGTAGLVTIEDILEELVGEISDEHEPLEPAMLDRLNQQSAEADARIYIDQLNRMMALNLPEDAGYDTLGGYVSTTLGRIPEAGTVFEQDGIRFTVLDAEPHKVNRVRIELLPQPVSRE